MLESTLQKQVISWLRTIPRLFVIKTVTTNRRGIPDLIICYRGYFIYIELKTKSAHSTLTPLQLHTIKTLDSCGAYGFVATSLQQCQENLLNIIDKLDNTLDN